MVIRSNYRIVRGRIGPSLQDTRFLWNRFYITVYETRLIIDGPFPLTFLVLSILESLDASFQQIRHATIPALYIPAQTRFENYFRSC